MTTTSEVAEPGVEPRAAAASARWRKPCGPEQPSRAPGRSRPGHPGRARTCRPYGPVRGRRGPDGRPHRDRVRDLPLVGVRHGPPDPLRLPWPKSPQDRHVHRRTRHVVKAASAASCHTGQPLGPGPRHPYSPTIAFHSFAKATRSLAVMSRAMARRSRIAPSGKISGSSASAARSLSLAEARISRAAGTGQT